MPTQFSRNELLLGHGSTAILATKTVAIFGIGGVGSFVAEALARSGIGRLILVDDDRVCLTNINRQLIATRKTLGIPKVEAMRARILEINPDASVEAVQSFYGESNAESFPMDGWSYVVDCIDTVSSKILLVENAKRYGIPIISCMGAGNKLDPTRFEIADISETSVCPLARVMRRELRKRGIGSLKVLYSREIPTRPEAGSESDCKENCVCPPGTARTCASRRQVPGSVPFVPSVAGLIIAGEIVKDLLC